MQWGSVEYFACFAAHFSKTESFIVQTGWKYCTRLKVLVGVMVEYGG